MTSRPRGKAYRLLLREEILVEVWKQFCECGYSRIDLRAVYRELGITKGSVYWFWGDGKSGAGSHDRMIEEAIAQGMEGIEVFGSTTFPASYLFDYVRRFPRSGIINRLGALCETVSPERRMEVFGRELLVEIGKDARK